MKHDISTEDMQTFIKSSNAHISTLGLTGAALSSKRKELVSQFFSGYLLHSAVIPMCRWQYLAKQGRVINLKNLQQLKALLDNQFDISACLKDTLKCMQVQRFAASHVIGRDHYESTPLDVYLNTLIWILYQQRGIHRDYNSLKGQFIDMQIGGLSAHFSEIEVQIKRNGRDDYILTLSGNTAQRLNQQI